MKRKILSLLVCAVFTFGLPVCAFAEEKETGVYSPNKNYEYLVGSTVWQLSAESQALMQQAFSSAKANIDEMAAKCAKQSEPDWRYVEKSDGKKVMTYKGKPVAVISDIDDTLVDGAHYTANIVGQNGDYNNAAFARFVMSDGCTALPGAVDFAEYCEKNGVEIYYITNRYDQGYKIGQKDSLGEYPENGGGLYFVGGKEVGTTTYQVFKKSFYDITLESMKKLGFPIDDQHLIMNDLKLNGSSKEKARKAIINGTDNFPNGQRSDGNSTHSAITLSCEPHYVAMLLGDQLSDFTDDFSGTDLNAVRRAELTKKYSGYWGKQWIVMPNAVYGSGVDSAMKDGFPNVLKHYDYTESKKN